MKKLLLFGVILSSLTCSSQNSNIKDSASIKDSLNAIDMLHWRYFVDTDEMTSELIYLAVVTAKEQVALDFPYQGGADASIVVQNSGRDNLFAFRVSKGFIGGLGADNVSVRIRFDQEEPKQYTFYFPADRDKAVILGDSPVSEEILKKLKKAKRLRIEVPFLGGKTEVMEFNVSNLKWDHKGKEATVVEKSLKEEDGWRYQTDTDKMTSGVTYFAWHNATEELSFSFPYEGGSTANINLKYVEGVNIFWFYISKGHIVGATSDYANLRLRFDEEQPEYYKFYFPDNGKTNYVIVRGNDAEKIVTKLKRAKRLRMEVEFRREGSKIMEFNLAGLKWSHKGKIDSSKNSGTNQVQSKRKQQSQNSTNIFDQFFKTNSNSSSNEGNGANSGSSSNADSTYSLFKTSTSVTSTTTTDNGTSTSEISINGAVLDTKEEIDQAANSVKLHCIYTNNNKQKNTITIKAYFMDSGGKIIAEKSAALSCSGNVEVSTDITAKGILDKYKSYRIEIE